MCERQECELHEFFVLKILHNDKSNGKALRLLLNNFILGDEKILFSALTKLKIDYEDSENWHDAFSAVLVADLKKISVSREILYYIYENSLCSFCRERALRLLARKRWLTEDILNECLYDSDYEIRSWTEKKINRKYNKIAKIDS